MTDEDLKPPQPAPTVRLSDRTPKPGQKVMVTAKDHISEYGLPFICTYDGEGFIGPTGNRLTIAVVAWRHVGPFDKLQTKPYRPSRVVIHTPRQVSNRVTR